MEKQSRADWILLLHFFLGAVFAYFPAVVFYYTFIFFFYAVYKSFRAPHTAQYYAAYLISLEMLMRMSRSSIPHEFAKYAVCVVLFPALLRKKSMPVSIITYGLLLVPAFFLADGGSLEETRQLISFNFSGPLCLMISTIYFYNKPTTVDALKKIMVNMLYPVAAILGFLFVRTPALEEIDFGFRSNFSTSSYGPNQLASILGLALLVLGFAYLFRIKLFKSYITFFLLLFAVSYRGLLTFSRGGIIAPLIILAFIAVYLAFTTRFENKFKIVLSVALLTIIAYFSFDYVNSLTKNALYTRYTGETKKGNIGIDKFTSGRTLILETDMAIFYSNPMLGVGIGMAKFHREQYIGIKAAAHIEFTRMLAEHGVLGLISLTILLFLPVFRFFRINNTINKSLLIAGTAFCFIFMTHSATRLAAPAFLYGLGFVSVVAQHAVKRHPSKLNANESIKSFAGN